MTTPAVGAALRFTFDRDRLMALAAVGRNRYAAACPFPHIVVDDFLPPHVLDVVLAEFPKPGEVAWWVFDSDQERKLGSADDRVFGGATRHLLAEFNSGAFID